MRTFRAFRWGYGLRVRTEDIAKFGQLYLQRHKWNGAQLLPAEWVTMATSKQTANGSNPNSDAVRQARVQIELNGQSLVLTSATYHLPVTFAGVQVDCPITKGHVGNSRQGNAWGLMKEARIRVWPAGSPWIEPGTFVYPLKQRWFASHTQMANEPSFVDGGEAPDAKKIYYHYGLDSGGAEGMAEVVAAAAGRVISSGNAILPGYDDSPAKPRYDVVYLLAQVRQRSQQNSFCK